MKKNEKSRQNIWSYQKKAVPLHRISQGMIYRGVEQW